MSTQLNIRIPSDIKTQAQTKAKSIGINLNLLIKIFLSKFIEEDNLVAIKQDIDMEKIFDKGQKQYLSSTKAKNQTKKSNSYIADIIKNEKKYLS